MGLFDFFKSDEEKVRSKIRKGFDGCVRTAVKSAGTNDSFMLGILQKNRPTMTNTTIKNTFIINVHIE